MHALHMSLDRRRSKVARLAAIVGFLFLILALSFLSLKPTVEVSERPSTQDLRDARHVWQQLKRSQSGAATSVRVEHRTVMALAALASDALEVVRIRGGVEHGKLGAQASLKIPLSLWLNVSATASGSYSAFPDYQLTIGRVVFPVAAGRILAKLGRRYLLMRGATIPPLDKLVQGFSIGEDHVLATVDLPQKTALVDSVVAARSSSVDYALVATIFCELAAAQRAQPVMTLSEMLQRTFARAAAADAAAFNRAAFVALSLAVVGDKADALMPRAQQLRSRCEFPKQEIQLRGRSDLAKHWIFSAALTSALGSKAAESLGEWKELDDSRPNGSGFSFVDLAADRAGVQTAVQAVDTRSARATAAILSRASDEYLLPKALLKAPEGLSNAAFADRFGALDQEGYREAVSRIELVLAQHRDLD